ncbi:MAG: metallophosphoesterase [Saprospiraceae bacterium]|nr:metallophosphoesterase [Saprospiraceae bacterium]
MYITEISSRPIDQLPYLSAAPGTRKYLRKQVENPCLPILVGRIKGLPKTLDAIVVTSDLQGRMSFGTNALLLGEVLPNYLCESIKKNLPQLRPENIGIILCGDYYAVLEARGGLGDVRVVWKRFNEYFKWVVGVAGNHDSFGKAMEFEQFKKLAGIHYIQHEQTQVEGLNIAGISGIMGNKYKPQRVPRRDFERYFYDLAQQKPDLFLLHQSPSKPNARNSGEVDIQLWLEQLAPTLYCCGHRHWTDPLYEYKNGAQVLNVDKRAVILIADRIH